MKPYTLHKHPLRLERVYHDKSNKIVNQPLYDSIISKKSSIDKVRIKMMSLLLVMTMIIYIHHLIVGMKYMMKFQLAGLFSNWVK